MLSYYCEATKNDRTFLTWDNNLDEAKVEDGAIALERLEDELLGDHDGDPIHTSEVTWRSHVRHVFVIFQRDHMVKTN